MWSGLPRALMGAVAALLVASACAGERPTLDDGSGALPEAGRAAVLVAGSDVPAGIGDPVPPELIGARGRDRETTGLAFELTASDLDQDMIAELPSAPGLGAEADGDLDDALGINADDDAASDAAALSGAASAAPTDGPPPRAGAAERTTVPANPAADPVRPSDGEASAPAVALDDRAVALIDGGVLADQPIVAAAAPGLAPAYPDPTEAVVFATGRTFDVESTDAATTTRGLTDDTIRVAGVVTATIAGLPAQEDACLGAAARALQANEHAELTRTIEITGCVDDGGQVPLAGGIAAAHVRDGVFAVVPIDSVAFLGDRELGDARVPHVGAGTLPGWCGTDSSYGFGIAGAVDCPVLGARGYEAVVQPVISAWLAGDPAVTDDIVVLVEDSIPGRSAGADLAFEAELAGVENLEVMALIPGPSSTFDGDWSGVAARVVDRGAGVVVIDAEFVDGLPNQLRQLGFEGEIVVVGTVDPVAVGDATSRVALAPLTVVTPGVDLASRDTAGWVSMLDAADAVGVDAYQVSDDFIDGYLAMDFFVRAVAATPEPLTAEALHNSINSGWWYPGIEGLACGSWWPASHLIEVPCVSVAEVDLFEVELQPVQSLVQAAPQFRFALGD